MININRVPDYYKVSVEDSTSNDSHLEFIQTGSSLKVMLKAQKSQPRVVRLRWKQKIDVRTRFLGDEWERGYGNMCFETMSPESIMPWYVTAILDGVTNCFGVKVRPNSFVSFSVDNEGVTAYCDVRCGTHGVKLASRTLEVAEFLCKEYKDISSLDALTDFCRIMSPDPILPSEVIYGGNNWYYAYGKSSYDEIVSDAYLQAKLADGLEARPFMVIDDGWQPNSCAGPWIANERYGDMKKVADTFKDMNVRPGIWVRFLRDDRECIPDSYRLKSGKGRLDPSLPEVAEMITSDIKRIVNKWGYQLIKHDFSSYDCFGKWGKDINGCLVAQGDFTFADDTRTGAEIYKSFCKNILDSTEGKAYILGCNCVSHLTAGYCHINRTGDDTSGTEWNRTRKMGINTLSFRLAQNGTFYMSDADCAGFIPGRIDWNLNRDWITLLAHSKTPLFISCANGTLTPDQFDYVKEMYKIASKGGDGAIPLDWEYTSSPSKWLIGGEVREFDWFGDAGADFNE